MEYVIILLLGILLGLIIAGWLTGRDINKHLRSNRWFFTADLYNNNDVCGRETGIIIIHDLAEFTAIDAENFIVKQANGLGAKATRAKIVMFTKLA